MAQKYFYKKLCLTLHNANNKSKSVEYLCDMQILVTNCNIRE